MTTDRLEEALSVLRQVTINSEYADRLWIVGGYVRDKEMGRHTDADDIDIVLEGDAAALASFLHESDAVQGHAPVVYQRFGTAMVTVAGVDIELVTARKESYDSQSRKPVAVSAATLEEDALRRDFTINTLLENLHTGEVLDPLGYGRAHVASRIICTPRVPQETFADDPLRMLRAIRFAARLGFEIDGATWQGIVQNAAMLGPPKVSQERIRDEFTKILLGQSPVHGLELLHASGLLKHFAPEIAAMDGVGQNEFHAYAVWEHTLVALQNLVDERPASSLVLRLATLLHDVGKPSTRSVGNDGRVHFYAHQEVGTKIAGALLQRLKYPRAEEQDVVQLVAQHMRIGEYQPDTWSNAAVRRFIRSAGPYIDDLFALHKADVLALSADHRDFSRAQNLRCRIRSIETRVDVATLTSPLSGTQIMQYLGIEPGPEVGRFKEWLTDEVVEGRLEPGDNARAYELLDGLAKNRPGKERNK